MRYVIYTRVSGKKQITENQIREARQYVYNVKDKNDEICEFDEPDSTTKKPMHLRTKLQQLIAFLRRGDTLVVYKVDRLARDPKELITLYCDIFDKGIKIVSLNDPMCDRVNICIYAFVAASERQNISTRTKTGLTLKRSKNERVGAVTYGFKLNLSELQMKREDVPSYGKPYLMQPDPEEERQIRLMVDLFDRGYSISQIAKELELLGCKNRRGNRIHKMQVCRILRNLGKTHQVRVEEQANQLKLSMQ